MTATRTAIPLPSRPVRRPTDGVPPGATVCQASGDNSSRIAQGGKRKSQVALELKRVSEKAFLVVGALGQPEKTGVSSPRGGS